MAFENSNAGPMLAEPAVLPTESFPYPVRDAFQKLPLTLTQLSFMTPHNNFRATQKYIIHGAGEMA